MKGKIRGIIVLLRGAGAEEEIWLLSVLVIWLLVVLDVNVFRRVDCASVVAECVIAMLFTLVFPDSVVYLLFGEKPR